MAGKSSAFPGRAEMGTGGPSSPEYIHTPYLSSQKGHSQQIFRKKAPQHRHPSNPVTALTQGGVSVIPHGAVQHRPSDVPSNSQPHTPTAHTAPSTGTSQILPWFLNHLGFFVPRTSSSLSTPLLHLL